MEVGGNESNALWDGSEVGEQAIFLEGLHFRQIELENGNCGSREARKAARPCVQAGAKKNYGFQTAPYCCVYGVVDRVGSAQ